MQYQYNLYFITPFNILDSVKISGALSSAAFRLFPDKEMEINEEIKGCSLKISDLFPLDSANGRILLPVPVLPYSMPKNLQRSKRIEQAMDRKKSVSYSSLESIKRLMKEFLNGGEITKKVAMDIVAEGIKSEELLSGQYGETSEYGVSLLDEKPKVYVRELRKVGNLSFGEMKLLTYDPVCFIADYSMKKFSVSMALLEDAGLSSTISRGKGRFVYQRYVSDMEINFNGSGYYMILSKYCPSSVDLDNIDLSRSYYSIGTITGIANENSNLPKIRYFKPGSVLYLNGDISGKVVFTKNKSRILNFSAMKLKVA